MEHLTHEVGKRLVDADRLTHAAAAAVATAVSAAIDGSSWAQCLSLAVSAADAVEREASSGNVAWVPGPSMAARLAWAHALASRSAEQPLSAIEMLVGTSGAPQEALPAAFAVVGVVATQAADAAERLPSDGPMATARTRVEATRHLDPVEVARNAASMGGCAALIASVAGALAGALAGGESIPAHMRPAELLQALSE